MLRSSVFLAALLLCAAPVAPALAQSAPPLPPPPLPHSKSQPHPAANNALMPAAPTPNLPPIQPSSPDALMALPDVPIKPSGYVLGIYRLVHPGQPDDPSFGNIEQVLRSIADVAPNVKSVTYMAQPPKACDLEDDSCFALLGAFQQLDLIVLGSLTKADNGLALRVRLIDVASGKRLTQAQQIVASTDKTEIKSWAESLGCKLMIPGGCKGSAIVDLDLPEMQLIVDNTPLKRAAAPAAQTPASPIVSSLEKIELPVGPHRIRVTVGQRTSLERTLSILREPTPGVALYAREFEQGGLSLFAASDLPTGKDGRPVVMKSVRPIAGEGGKWTRPVGYVVAGLGVAAAGFGGYEYVHGKSLSDQANSRYVANQGAYHQGDLSTVQSAHSAKTLETVGLVAGGILVVAGLALAFAF